MSPVSTAMRISAGWQTRRMPVVSAAFAPKREQRQAKPVALGRVVALDIAMALEAADDAVRGRHVEAEGLGDFGDARAVAPDFAQMIQDRDGPVEQLRACALSLLLPSLRSRFLADPATPVHKTEHIGLHDARRKPDCSGPPVLGPARCLRVQRTSSGLSISGAGSPVGHRSDPRKPPEIAPDILHQAACRRPRGTCLQRGPVHWIGRLTQAAP